MGRFLAYFGYEIASDSCVNRLHGAFWSIFTLSAKSCQIEYIKASYFSRTTITDSLLLSEKSHPEVIFHIFSLFIVLCSNYNQQIPIFVEFFGVMIKCGCHGIYGKYT